MAEAAVYPPSVANPATQATLSGNGEQPGPRISSLRMRLSPRAVGRSGYARRHFHFREGVEQCPPFPCLRIIPKSNCGA